VPNDIYHNASNKQPGHSIISGRLFEGSFESFLALKYYGIRRQTNNGKNFIT